MVARAPAITLVFWGRNRGGEGGETFPIALREVFRKPHPTPCIYTSLAVPSFKRIGKYSILAGCVAAPPQSGTFSKAKGEIGYRVGTGSLSLRKGSLGSGMGKF